LLSSSQREQLLVEWNNTAKAYPQDRCIHELFEQQVERTPDAVALVFEDQRISYGELNARANQLAHSLIERGLQPGEFVAISLRRSISLVIAELAVIKAGAVYVPLDPELPEERQRQILGNCNAHWLLVWGHDVRVNYLQGISIVDISDPEIRAETSPCNLKIKTHSDAPIYVMYTSGSTGQSKGVVASHQGVSRLIFNNGFADFRPEDRTLFVSNPAFDASTLEVWAPLLTGGCCVIVSQQMLFEPKRFVAALRDHAVNMMFLTVGLFHQYHEELAEVLPQMRYVMTGGDVLDPRIMKKVLVNSPPQHLLSAYGPTETTTFATTYEITADHPERSSIPLGRPIGNTQIYILDKRLRPVPMGVTGELYIGGPGVALGYLNQVSLTEERFLKDPFSQQSNARMYKTGDLGRWLATGNIEFLGRNDFQVKIRGFRIELGEIETQLSQVSGIQNLVVLARAGENPERSRDKKLVAYYTGDVDAQTLRDHARNQLPPYMVPEAYVQMTVLPLTPNGKIDRKALPAPEVDSYVCREYEAPQGELEIALSEIWAQVLKQDKIGRHDNFFDLGGHSLLAVSLIEHMRQAGYFADVQAIFLAPSLAELALQVKEGSNLFEALPPPNLIPDHINDPLIEQDFEEYRI
jgi:amino acid adenylation domain-containing protein